MKAPLIKYVRWFFLALLVALQACGNSPFFAENTDLKGESWSGQEPVSFAFVITDTLSAYDFFIDIRNNTNYAFSNLYVFLDLTHQDQLVIRDTIELPITEASGKWTGSVSGTLVDNHFLTYPQMVFTKPGAYKIMLQQAMMGQDELAGIASVGVSLYPSK